MDNFTRDKYSYVGILLTSILALSEFRSDLSTHRIHVLFWEPTIFQTGIVFVILLGVASYMFAFSFISSSERFQNKIAKGSRKIADLFYATAIWYPVGVVLIWSSQNVSSQYASLVSSLISLLSTIPIYTFYRNLEKQEKERAKIKPR